MLFMLLVGINYGGLFFEIKKAELLLRIPGRSIGGYPDVFDLSERSDQLLNINNS